MTAILGIPAFLHIMRGCGPDRGQTDRRCTQEEHFTRNKHDVGFSGHVIDYCLQAAGLTANQLGLSASTISPCLNPSVCLEAHLAYAPYAPAGSRLFLRNMSLWSNQKLYLPRELSKNCTDSTESSMCSPSITSRTRPAPSIHRPMTRRRS